MDMAGHFHAAAVDGGELDLADLRKACGKARTLGQRTQDGQRQYRHVMLTRQVDDAPGILQIVGQRLVDECRYTFLDTRSRKLQMIRTDVLAISDKHQVNII